MKYKLMIKGHWLFFALLALLINTILLAERMPFEDGEKLIFSLKWMGMIGGKSTIEIKEETPPDSYLLNATLKTVGLADIAFRIRDEFSSFVVLNSKQVLPVWWEVFQKEKNYKYNEKTDFEEMLKKEPELQNPLSALWLLRSKNWQMEESINVPIFVHGKIYPIKVQAISKEPLKIYGETFDTILIDVAVENLGVEISSTKLKDFKIWLTDDDKKLPIFMKANTSVGVVNVLLDNRKEFYKEK
jgi:hypothetical protein